MGLSQEVTELKNEYKQAEQERKKNIAQVERLTKQLEQARQDKETQKDNYILIENAFEDYLYAYFEKFDNAFNYSTGYYYKDRHIETAYKQLTLIKKKNEVIKEICQGDLECRYLNKIYYKKLDYVYKIVKRDRETAFNLRPDYTEEFYRRHNASVLNSINEFEKVTGQPFHSNDNFNKKVKKNGFIAFLNMILK